MATLWDDKPNGRFTITTMTDLGEQTVCDEHGVLDLMPEIRYCKNIIQADHILHKVMRNLEIMEVKGPQFTNKSKEYEYAVKSRQSGKTEEQRNSHGMGFNRGRTWRPFD